MLWEWALSQFKNLFKSGGFLGATDSAVPCAQMLNLAHAMDRDLKEHGKNKACLFWFGLSYKNEIEI